MVPPARAWREVMMVATVLAAACDPSPSRRVSDTGTTAAAQPCRPARSATELTEAVGRATGSATWAVGESLTPPFPTQWPPVRAGGIVYFTYRFTPLPTGRVTSRVRGPVRQVTFTELGAEPTVETLDGPVLGTVDDSSVGDDSGPARLTAATEALIEVVAGCRPAEGARAVLAPYVTWLRENGPIADDLARRLPAFMAWLQEGR